MSNTNTNFDYAASPFPESGFGAPIETQSAPGTAQPAPKKKKNVPARIFAALLAAISVAVVFLLKFKVVVGNVAKEITLFDAVKDVFGDGANKAYGLLVLAETESMVGKVAGLALYGTVAFLALAVVLGVIAVFCSKKAPAFLRATAFFLTSAFAVNALGTSGYTYYTAGKGVIDLFSLVLVGVGALVYFVLALAKNGKRALVNTLQFILTAAVVVAIALCLTEYKADFVSTLEKLLSFQYVALIFVGVAAIDLVIAAIRIQTKKGLVVDFIRYIVQFILGVGVSYVVIASKETQTLYLIFAIAAAAVSLLQIVIGACQKKCGGKKKIKAAKEPKAKKEKAEKVKKEEVAAQAPAEVVPAIPAPVVAPVYAATPAPVVAPVAEVKVPADYVVEEYAEALPYDGGPVEGVEIAQEVNPTYVAPNAPVQTAGYDFYNSKSFDPFIAVLDTQERNQFTELFILKYKGVMPEIPDYQVGGDNKEFFRKLFIYLGQYRDRIPDGLLAKIYQFTIKM